MQAGKMTLRHENTNVVYCLTDITLHAYEVKQLYISKTATYTATCFSQ